MKLELEELRNNCIAIDNLVDGTMIKHAYYHFKNFYYWQYGNKSGNPDDNLFFITNQCKNGYDIMNDPLVQYLLHRFTDETGLEVTDYEDLYVNGQTLGLDGSMHIDRIMTREVYDEARFTIMYMVNPYNTDVIGNFVFGEHEVPFTPGRFVIFDALSSHRGLSPSIGNDMRMTLTWKNCGVKKVVDTDED